MGDAKRRRQQFFERHPLCCFCGGRAAATTIDHVPAKITFWGKRRPAGLEMPACTACNGGTKNLERAAALFAHIRMADNRTPEQREEHLKLARGVGIDFPGWQHEFYAVPDHDEAGRVPAGVKPMNVGPLMQDAIHAVGAKLAFTLHYHHTGTIVPEAGFVSVRFETNVTIQSRQLPPDQIALLRPTELLRQGEWTSEGHFAYRGNWVTDGSGSVFIAHLGEAFFLVLRADAEAPEAGEFNHQDPALRLVRPGDLQQADAVARKRYKAMLPVDRLTGAASGTLGFEHI